MKSIIGQIEKLDKTTAKDFKHIAEIALSSTMEEIKDENECERIAWIIDDIIFSCKERIKEISMKELNK